MKHYRGVAIPFMALFILSITACNKEGCTDISAVNYDSEATKDDGSCEYVEETIPGCTDSVATNYDPDATVDDGSCEYPVTESPCVNEEEFCMNYDGAVKSGDVEVSDFNNGTWRIYWTTGIGSNYEQVELDIHGNATGLYNIDTTGVAGTASVQYYHGTNGVDNVISGSVDVSVWDPNGDGLTGTFSGSTESSKEITNGNFFQAK